MSVSQISPHLTQLDAPDFLAHKPGWLIWRFEHNDQNAAKPLKVPYYANGTRRYGVQGSDSDRGQLVTFLDAKRSAARRGFSGVGFCLLPEFEIVAGDFDNCVTKPGQEDKFVHTSVLDLTLGTYAEYSPSDTGVRAFWRSPSMGNGKDPHGEPFGLEVFSTKGFVTFTGRPLWQTEFNGCEDHIAPLPPATESYITGRLGPNATHGIGGTGDDQDFLMTYTPPRSITTQAAQTLLAKLDASMPREPWLKVGMALHHEFSGSEEAFSLFDAWSQGGATYGTGTPIETVWNSFGAKPGSRPVTWSTVQKMANETRNTDPDSQAESDLVSGFVHVDSFAAKSIDHATLIKDLLPRAVMGVIFGASGSGKTFIALDIALSVARGEAWRNGTKRTVKTGVAYIVAEGDMGLVKRVRGYRDHVLNQKTFGQDVPFHLLTAAPDLMDEKKVDYICDMVNELPGEIGLIVVDTLAQTMRGDENSAQDMGKYASHCRRIHRKTGAMVLLIHHSGKDAARGMRGSSTLFAAADTVLEVSRETDCRVIRASKMKDDDDASLNYPFVLKSVLLGTNQYGEDVTTCVVDHSPPQAAPKLSPTQQDVFDGIATLAELDLEFSVGDLVHVVLKTRNERKAQASETGEGYTNLSDQRGKVKGYVQKYADSPDCGIEVVGDRVTITRPEMFNL